MKQTFDAPNENIHRAPFLSNELFFLNQIFLLGSTNSIKVKEGKEEK